MKRFLEDKLQEWRKKDEPMPLIIRGARQVGKSYLIEKFGTENFENFLEINFEFEPEFKDYFEKMDPKIISEKISALKGIKIEIGKTLLFLDEIQQCPNAIKALRYFYEKMPGLHVIAAGSLLDFALKSSKISLPVGRVQFIYMQAMSFNEYLAESDSAHLLNSIQEMSLGKKLDPNIHDRLLEELRRYFILGGMPKVLKEYFETGNYAEPFDIQDSINLVYKEDFGKYASLANHKYLNKVFSSVPKLTGKKFKYSNVDREIRTVNLKSALDLLVQARVVNKIKRTSGSGLPFEAEASEKHFKTLFLDVGLMQKMLGVDSGLSKEIIESKDFHSIAAGAIAEQFVGQELLAYQNPHTEKSLYYWEREAKNSSAEVDYLTELDGQIFPIEVKAGKTGKLKSLNMFVEKYKIPFGIKISQQSLAFENKVLSVPLYAISELPRLIRSI